MHGRYNRVVLKEGSYFSSSESCLAGEQYILVIAFKATLPVGPWLVLQSSVLPGSLLEKSRGAECRLGRRKAEDEALSSISRLPSQADTQLCLHLGISSVPGL